MSSIEILKTHIYVRASAPNYAKRYTLFANRLPRLSFPPRTIKCSINVNGEIAINCRLLGSSLRPKRNICLFGAFGAVSLIEVPVNRSLSLADRPLQATLAYLG